MNFRLSRACAAAAVALLPLAAAAQSTLLTIADSARACPARPAYPASALRSQAMGRSLVRVMIDDNGDVASAYLVRPSGVTPFHAALDNASVGAARQCHYPRAAGGGSALERRGVVEYDWRIDGVVESNAYATDPLESLKAWAVDGNAEAAYWLYLRADPPTWAAAPASAEALHWLRFAAGHGMEKAQQEVERLGLVGENVGSDDEARHETP